MVYIADTYNHKIKKTSSDGDCKTLCGSGKPSKDNSVSSFDMKSLLKFVKGNDESSSYDVLFQFDEPSGLAVSQDGDTLYIADTNNHCIKALDLKDVKNISIVRYSLIFFFFIPIFSSISYEMF